MTTLVRRSIATALVFAGWVASAHAGSFDPSRAVTTRTALGAADQGVSAARDVRTANPRGDGIAISYGPSISAAGDLNGNGYTDQLIGLPVPGVGGTVKIVYRSSSGATVQTLTEPVAQQAAFGQSVTAADVNGDGFTDVVVGDPLQSNGVLNEGAIFVYHGTAFGVPSLPTSTRYHGGTGSNFGYSVSYAGDVNGDGYDDIIVGAPTYEDDLTMQGAAFVYLGGPNGIAADPAWELFGTETFGWLGYDVSTAGDMNGDGFDDVLVGEPFYTDGEANEGRVHLYLGGPGGVQGAGARLYEANVFDARLGWSVATAGDADADGFCEYAAGAPYYSNGQLREGAVYLFEGAQSPFIANPPIIAEGGTAEHQYGHDLACGGDFNGDGLADLIAGRPGYPNVGAYDVMLGLWDLSQWPFPGSFYGTVPGGQFGQRVAIGGDVDGDGFSDPLTIEYAPLRAPAAGSAEPTLVEVHGFSLSVLGFGTRDLLSAGPFDSQNGTALATGDVNGDGFDDVVSGAPSTPFGVNAGRLQLYLGHPGGIGTPPPAPFVYPPTDWTFDCPVEGAALGATVAMADVNGDGYDDVIAGARGYENGQSSEGAVYAFYGSPGGPSTSPDWLVEGNAVAADFGFSVASAGDVNGDGYADVIVGAPSRALGEADEGAAYLYYGSPLGLSNVAARSYEGNAIAAGMGMRVSGLGDIDGDGWDDFGIGVPGYSNGEVNEGAIFVFRGAPAGPGSPFDVVESNVAGTRLGTSFCGAGDVNGDGKGDLLCGLPDETVGFSAEGQLRLFYGSVTGFAAFPEWSLEGGAANVALGTGVSTAGDINGDGLSDFIAGAPGAYAGIGAAWVYLGSTTVPQPFPVQELAEGSGGGLTGWSVVGGGDFNGDGFGDFATGSPRTAFGKGAWDGTVDYALAGVLLNNAIVHRPIDAYRPLSDTQIGTGLRSDAANSYRLRGHMRSIAGRTRVRTEVESKPIAAAFNGLGTLKSPWVKIASPAAGYPNVLPVTLNVTGLAANTKHKWRARYMTKSPLFNPSHWISPQANGITQGDVRTAGSEYVVDVPPAVEPGLFALASAWPNPVSGLAPATFAFALPKDGRVTLALHDASGRRTRLLVDRDAPAGAGAVTWDLKDDAGTRVAAGVYFARLVFAGESRESKVVVLP